VDDRDALSSALPEPPPAAPAQRERAIASAMARFEGRPAVPEIFTARQRWLVRRPQLGLAMAAALVVVVGLPMAWMYVDEPAGHSPRAAPATATPTSNAPHKAELIAPPPQTAMAAPESSAGRTKTASAPASRKPVREAVENAPAAAPPPSSTQVDDAQNVRAVEAPQRIVAAPPAPVIMARVAPPPPPPAAAASGADTIVVTGALRRASNDNVACTLDDPRQDLSFCKRWIDPAAEGDKGRAAAHVADGLMRAWQGDTQGAIAAFDAAIVLAPKLGIAYLERSQAYARLGEAHRALEDADKAVRYAPDARAYANRATLWRQRGDLAKARADERRAEAFQSAQ
jgi:hypothetical protein